MYIFYNIYEGVSYLFDRLNNVIPFVFFNVLDISFSNNYIIYYTYLSSNFIKKTFMYLRDFLSSLIPSNGIYYFII